MRVAATVVACLCALCIAACGGKSPTTTPRTVSRTSVRVSTATALMWPKVFCALRPGVSQAQIIQLMGAPTSTGTNSSGAATIEWLALGYEFSVDLNAAGETITKLHVVRDAESSLDTRMTSRLHGCPWL